MDDFIPQGHTIIVSDGEYSYYKIDGVLTANKDIDVKEMEEAFKVTGRELHEFVEWAIEAGYMMQVDDCVELYIGCYGESDFQVT